MATFNHSELAYSHRESVERAAAQQASENASGRLRSEANELSAQRSGAAGRAASMTDNNSRAAQSEAMTKGPEAILPSLGIDLGNRCAPPNASDALQSPFNRQLGQNQGQDVPSGKPEPLEGWNQNSHPPSGADGGRKSDYTAPQ